MLIAPGNADCRIVEADLLLFQREADQAYKSLKPLYASHSNRRDFLSSLARAAAMSGRQEEARQYQQEIVPLIEREAVRDESLTPAVSLPVAPTEYLTYRLCWRRQRPG